MKKYLTLITLLILSNIATAAPQRFDFTFAENAGTGRATGFIVFESTLLANPGGGFYTLPNAFILDMQITVTGTATGDGVFTLSDYTDIAFNTGGIALDFSRDLFGQLTDFSPWGTSGQGTKASQIKGRTQPEFRLFSTQPKKLANISSDTTALALASPPVSIAPFIISASGGVSMPLISFAPAVSTPIPTLSFYAIVFFGLLLLLFGFWRLTKQ